jgi:hypothetical protein
MNEQALKRQVRDTMYPASYEPYGLQDMLQSRPKFDAIDIQGLRHKYNQTQPQGSQYSSASPAEEALRGLQSIFDTAMYKTNARD